ncbi:hypothetical protein SESBI_14161 [Sesbania bispinosa]|nr:hypothetical protein SESBI_14161 [Sesbania bispinosa]
MEIKNLLLVENVDFLYVQEMKTEVVDNKLCVVLGNEEDLEWAYVPSTASSRGLLSIWQKYVKQPCLCKNENSYGLKNVKQPSNS